MEEGEQHLGQVCGEAERLLLHLPKAGSGQVQERLSSCQRDWVGYKEGCRQTQQDLEEGITLLTE